VAVDKADLIAEKGLTLEWTTEFFLSDSSHSPFAKYNEGAFSALSRLNP
jgi:hypothetical protein